MNSLTEVESAIQKLSAIEVRQLAEWLQNYLNTQGNTEHEETEFTIKISLPLTAKAWCKQGI